MYKLFTSAIGGQEIVVLLITVTVIAFIIYYLYKMIKKTSTLTEKER